MSLLARKLLRLLPRADAETLRLDLLAGVTIALFALPQAMAYALLAGVEPKHGLYAYMVGCVVGGVTVASYHFKIGPTNAAAIVAASAVIAFTKHENFMSVVFALTLLVGLIQVGAGLLRLGNLTQFISRAVLEGFIAAGGVMIAINQLPNLLGFRAQSSFSILEGIRVVGEGIHQWRAEPLALGIGTVLAVMALNRLSPRSRRGVPLLPAHLIAILLAAGVVALTGGHERGVRVVGEIPASLPPFSLPSFDMEVLRALAPGAVAVALIALSESVSIAKSIAAASGARVNADRDFVGIGLANIAASFFSGMPVSGSLTRTVLSQRLGAATPLVNVFSGVALAVAALAFSPIVRYIPVAALAGMLIQIGLNMVNWRHVRIAFRTTRADALAMAATFASTLFVPLDQAIYFGVAVSIVLFLRRVQQPRLIELAYDAQSGFYELKNSAARPIPEISIIHLEGDIFFGAAELLLEQMQRIARRPEIRVVILRVRRAYALDTTSILALMQFCELLKRRQKRVLVSGMTDEIESMFARSGLTDVIGRENMFRSDGTLLKSTRAALARAVEQVNAECGTQYRLT